jgi:hypothetical protein
MAIVVFWPHVRHFSYQSYSGAMKQMWNDETTDFMFLYTGREILEAKVRNQKESTRGGRGPTTKFLLFRLKFYRTRRLKYQYTELFTEVFQL